MRRICVAVILAFLAVSVADAQIFCWNLENYFDAADDPLAADEAFTPGGEHHWTRRKFEAKRNLIAKTIIASAECFEGDLPAVVGLCEVENGAVLHSLLEDTPLAKFRYRSVHRESPDPRGIDVALLYDPERVKLLSSDFITIKEFATREILYAKVALSCDTLHIYVNHWPSKYSGAKVSEAKRQAVSDALLAHLDSLRAVEPDAKVIAMGDFNDTPDAAPIVRLCERAGFDNLSKNISGTIRFKGKWETIDLLLASPAAAAIIGTVEAYKPDFLLEEDKAFLGRKPRRTNVGPRYNGGASDHLPIVANLSAWHLHH
ncbi:MAG: endonuclease [Bacteroidales bacterium]|nr:endonuclease [Bacteroidales bacterium]